MDEGEKKIKKIRHEIQDILMKHTTGKHRDRLWELIDELVEVST